MARRRFFSGSEIERLASDLADREGKTLFFLDYEERKRYYRLAEQVANFLARHGTLDEPDDPGSENEPLEDAS